jgi:hypothetical protein
MAAKAKPSVRLHKAHKGHCPPCQKAHVGASVVNFVLQDNGDDTCTVFGVDAAGTQLDISAIASLTPAPTSSDTTAVTIDAPVGMTFTIHSVVPVPTPLPAPGTIIGHSDITATATWNDGSLGPFTFTLPVDVTVAPPGGPTGIIIVPGTPVIH